jgi:hypothetical protein
LLEASNENGFAVDFGRYDVSGGETINNYLIENVTISGVALTRWL